MPRFLKKALLAFLLGWLPLQASALPLIALLCGQDPVTMHGHAAAHAQHGHGEPSGADHHGDGGDGSPPAQAHFCCHNLTSAAVPWIAAAATDPASGIAPTPLPHLDSFVPELPQPPPLAA